MNNFCRGESFRIIEKQLVIICINYTKIIEILCIRPKEYTYTRDKHKFFEFLRKMMNKFQSSRTWSTRFPTRNCSITKRLNYKKMSLV